MATAAIGEATGSARKLAARWADQLEQEWGRSLTPDELREVYRRAEANQQTLAAIGRAQQVTGSLVDPKTLLWRRPG